VNVIFITANLPHGTDEAFIVPEIEGLIRAGHRVLVVPRSPRGPVLHGSRLLQHSRRESLFSFRVLRMAAAVAAVSMSRVAAAVPVLFRSRSLTMVIKNLAVLPKALWLSRVATQWGADHIHCHWAGTTASMAMVASKISGIPWSFTAHRWDVVENNLLAEKAKGASFARFISEDGLKMAKAFGVGSAGNARVLFMGVALPFEVERHSGPYPIVICPARLVEVKGHRVLLEAWSMLRKRGVAGELWLAGDGELRPQLEALTASLEVHDSVRFLGFVPHEKLLRMYNELPVTAVVLASADLGNGVHEGIPVALIEAMGYGIPVVSTRAGATPELVKTGTGILVPPQDAPALADALERLLRDRDFGRQLGDEARRHVVEAHDITAVTAQLARAFEEAVPRPARRVSAGA
jgi:colanic acid/amylovoran biosynthesis glycosyltransferase